MVQDMLGLTYSLSMHHAAMVAQLSQLRSGFSSVWMHAYFIVFACVGDGICEIQVLYDYPPALPERVERLCDGDGHGPETTRYVQVLDD